VVVYCTRHSVKETGWVYSSEIGIHVLVYECVRESLMGFGILEGGFGYALKLHLELDIHVGVVGNSLELYFEADIRVGEFGRD